MRGFVDLVDHPWVREVCEAVLGPDYEIVELGFDIPFAGAMNQPWHRDFPAPAETAATTRLTSLAFNLTAVDTTRTWARSRSRPAPSTTTGPASSTRCSRRRRGTAAFEERAVRKYPQRGDISARSALTIHRGTRNDSQKSPSGARPRRRRARRRQRRAPRHGGHQGLLGALPERVRAHLTCPVVDELTPITQKHTIEGLVMGEA